MEWDLKMPWDLAELEPNAEPNMGSMVGTSSRLAAIQGGGASRVGLDCSVDLKLGGLGDFGSAEKWKDHQQQRALNVGSTASPSGSGSSKRARAPSSGSQNVSCLVDGCRADLSNCREYHRRHKVCEVHSKTRIVMVGGQEQRFCQQCSRFHSLAEFDEEKRSCRKRLDGHNRRRRKPQPESINSGGLFTNHHGNRFSSYSQMYPTAISDPSWPVIVKTEDEPLYPHHQPMHLLDCQQQHFSSSFARGKHFPFLQDTEPSICQPLLNTISSAESSSGKIFSNGLPQVLDSDCALSLLSSPPQTSAINLGQIMPTADRIPVGQPLLNYGGRLGLGRFSGSSHMSSRFSSGMEDEQMAGRDAVLVSDASEHEMSCQGLFGVGGEGSSDGGSHALPFSW